MERPRWIIILGCFLIINTLFAQSTISEEKDFRHLLGDDYLDAESLVRDEPWMADTLSSHGLDALFALSVVFPEIIRYSSRIDFFQLAGLEVLYVQNGAGYANFSVGWFQMKPSFAERIEADLLKKDLASLYPSLSRVHPDTTGSPEARRKRLDRLKDPYSQVLYLEAFLRIMDWNYPSSRFESTDDKLSFYATAYNTGYFKNEGDIRLEMGRNRLYMGLDSEGDKYNYKDISLYYYHRENVP